MHMLITGAGAPGAPGIIRCLEEASWISLTAGDADDQATGRYLAPDFVQLPLGSDLLFADTVLQICLKRGISIVLPLVTKELLPLAQKKDVFARQGVRIL